MAAAISEHVKMHGAPTHRSRFRALVPRYSIRTLLVGVALAAVLVQFGPPCWRGFTRYREARQYATLQAAQKWPIAALESFVIDEGRGVPDDFAILVRRGNTFGCFIPRKQFKKGESVEYDWYYRSDGLGQFSPSDPQVQSGHGFAGPYVSGSGQSLVITFGPFTVPWSGNGPGWGFIYFDYNPVPADRSAPDVLRICSTDIKSLNLIDARDVRWTYKSHREDPGLPGNQDAKTPTTSRDTD
jgi:hypothetical protein